jgi:hypothetical protein
MHIIIVSFSYDAKLISHHQPISSSFIDIHRLYKYASETKSNYTIITDNRKYQLPSNICQFIGRGCIDLDIYNFDLSKSLIISTLPKLLEELSKLFLIDDNILFYYSGHGLKTGFLIPDENVLTYDKLMELVSSIKKELFIVMDCCHPSSLNLAYRLNERFRLQRYRRLISQEVLLICSSSEDERSISTDKGSIFTELLFNSLKDMRNKKIVANLSKLLIDINKKIKDLKLNKQNVMIYSSYPRYVNVPEWILGKNKSIIYNPKDKTIELF